MYDQKIVIIRNQKNYGGGFMFGLGRNSHICPLQIQNHSYSFPKFVKNKRKKQKIIFKQTRYL